MKRSTTRTLGQLGAVSLVALALWVGTYFGVTRGLMADVMLLEESDGQHTRIIDFEFPWEKPSADPFADPTPWEKIAVSRLFEPLAELETKLTGNTVVFSPLLRPIFY